MVEAKSTKITPCRVVARFNDILIFYKVLKS